MKAYKNYIVTSLFCLSFVVGLFGQSPYELNWKMDAPLLISGVGGSAISKFVIAEEDGFTLEEIDQVDANTINSFDRRAVDFYSRKDRVASDVTLIASYTLPFLLLTDKQVRNDWLTIGVMVAEVISLNGATTSIVKELRTRARPLVYNPDVPLHLKMETNAKASFYSGHTSSASSMTFFSAKVFSDYFPDSKWKPAVWTVAAVLPAAMGYFRVKGGKHFPTDVITGYAAGAVIGYLIPCLHKKKEKGDKLGFSVYPSINGIGLTMTW